MSTQNFRITARVPVFVKADDQTIVCNSTRGYRLWLRDKATGERTLIEEFRGAVQKSNPYTRPHPEDSWEIEAI